MQLLTIASEEEHQYHKHNTTTAIKFQMLVRWRNAPELYILLAVCANCATYSSEDRPGGRPLHDRRDILFRNSFHLLEFLGYHIWEDVAQSYMFFWQLGPKTADESHYFNLYQVRYDL